MKKHRRRLSSFKKQRSVGEFTRRPKRRNRRSAVRWNLSRALVPALIALIALSLVMIAGIVLRSVRTRKLNAELAALHAAGAMLETPAPVEEMSASVAVQALPALTPEPERAASPEPEPAPAAEETDAPVRFHQVGGTPLAHMETLYSQNHDLIAWLEIPDVIDLPVMYKDNVYYLTHDFNKSKNASGTIFLDENHRFTEQTQNLLLHGHNMKDGTMFGRLVHYLQDIDYYRSHPFVHLDTLWEEEEYVIFAVLRVSLDVRDESFINYFSHPTFLSDASFDAYVRQLQLHSAYAVPIDVKPTDALLTLSTCIDEDRLVIVCRRLREGETRTRLRELVRLAQKQ